MKAATLTLTLALLSGQALAQAGTELKVPYEKYTLDNGLEVILHVDERLPVVAVNVWYHVGAFHEPQGRSGFAHLFEHMMFQGSQHVGDDQHIALMERVGGTDLNGTTNFYRTNYFQTVPTNHLETALWLESDRMGFLVPALTQAKLDTQKEVVKNERRQRVETAPYGVANELLWQALFPLPHPYHGRVIGSMKDLDAASVEDVADFFNTWYAPSNATLTLAGDIDPAQAKPLVQKYFGSLPRRPEPVVREVKKVDLGEEVKLTLEEKVATLPGVFMAWHSPEVFQEGDAEADILAAILSEGMGSRLHRRLVRERRIAQSVSASQWSIKSQSVFMVDGIAAPGHSAQELQREIDLVLAEVADKGVTAQEVQRARNKIETSFVAGLQSVGGMSGKADRMQSYNHFFKEPDGFARDLGRYEAVTPERVQQFARKLLRPQARAVMLATPAEPSAAKEIP